jgi:putative endopeptidase
VRNWWSKTDAQTFDDRARKLGLQYSAFEPLPGIHLNGDLTMGENVADLGGLSIALDAWRASLKGNMEPILDGFTGEQRVFLGYAQIWRSKGRDDALRRQLVSNPHAPGLFRTNVVVRNLDAWYDAFGVKPDDKLYISPGERVRIW